MYTPAKERYETMEYNRCGESGLMLPKVSLGLWHNFGDTSDYENMKRGCRISKYFCWAAAPFYAKMASKLITILMPFFTSAVRP